MSKPEVMVTVCVPTIGRMEYLPAVVEAMAAQTFTDYEILVLDNDSPEPAKTFLEEWAAKEPRVKLMRVSPRVPMFDNFDRGIRAAKGRYVTFVHDDDVYLPHFIDAQVKLLEQSPRAGFSGAAFDLVDEQGKTVERRRWVPKTAIWPGKRYIETLVRTGRNLIPMPGLMYRTEVFGGRGFDRDVSPYFGDFTILSRIAERYDVGVIAEPVMYVRKHTAQASRSFPVSEWAPMRSETLRAYCTEYLGRHPEDAAFVAKLRRSVEIRHRVALLWGWASAEERRESRVCTELFGQTAADRAAGQVLRGIERLGARRLLKRIAEGDGIRKLARVFRV